MHWFPRCFHQKSSTALHFLSRFILFFMYRTCTITRNTHNGFGKDKEWNQEQKMNKTPSFPQPCLLSNLTSAWWWVPLWRWTFACPVDVLTGCHYHQNPKWKTSISWRSKSLVKVSWLQLFQTISGRLGFVFFSLGVWLTKVIHLFFLVGFLFGILVLVEKHFAILNRLLQFGLKPCGTVFKWDGHM